MSPKNRASWLPAPKSATNVVESAPYTSPTTNELVIKTKAIALNPADVVIQQLGVLIQHYPAILGCDVAGEVVEVDPSLADRYELGNRVIGTASCLDTRDGKYCYAGFQEYVVLKAPQIAKIPVDVSYQDAVVLPLGILASASSLFAVGTLALSIPDAAKPPHGGGGLGKTVVVWGASSSVGSCGVQLAAQAGYEVIGVASGKNHQMVKSLGAAACFDQNDPSIVDSMLSYLQGKQVEGAFCSIASDSALDTLSEILDRSEGRKLVASVIPGAETKGSKGVTIVTNLKLDVHDTQYMEPVWKWLNQAMVEKKVKYAPPPEVVGNGLEAVQEGVDLLAKGVSAKKLVVLV
ncbi:zinc binding dehydrogenase [Talaromyces proteolyticus]|uniref:Zinc binding dehydrogenase n=1 Tax=Talaromyces proteolyticus TaxID=1131652 RepID=A0AAD4L2Y2_9EURO|nr:zinc binding dehydrogenase [Talaromyces proteolyticus]KAH8704962.1 zinc binding dehydrogenase [Talaromyces proteolyticus]